MELYTLLWEKEILISVLDQNILAMNIDRRNAKKMIALIV